MENEDDKISNAKLCAENGWKATFVMLSGEVHKRVFITGVDWDKGVLAAEKIGERHLPPRVIILAEVQEVIPDWS